MKQPRATRADLVAIREGNWDGYGDLSRLIKRLYFSLIDTTEDLKSAKESSRAAWSKLDTK